MQHFPLRAQQRHGFAAVAEIRGTVTGGRHVDPRAVRRLQSRRIARHDDSRPRFERVPRGQRVRRGGKVGQRQAVQTDRLDADVRQFDELQILLVLNFPEK